MAMTDSTKDWFEDRPAAAKPDDEVLYVDVDGYEGPLDLLLDLARKQKLDLASISVLALAEQYLAFIDSVRRKRIEIAADYLVMAAWLAYLKSRLMVPQAPGDDEPSGEEMAAILQFRLARLEAMRTAGEKLLNRSRLGLRIFSRGNPEPIIVERSQNYEASLYDLLKAYAIQRERGIVTDYAPASRTVWSLQDAQDLLRRLIGESMDWIPLNTYLADYLAAPEDRASVIASSFSASLELVRQGELELSQTLTYGPLLLRRRQRDRTDN
jgi:segregation and condensation protein A